MTTTVKLNLEDAEKIIKKHGLSPGGEVQLFLSNELLRISDPYTPFKSGMLKDTAFVPTDGTYIEYTMPYSRYLWYGKLMVDPVTKKGAFFSPEYGFWSRPRVQKELTETDLRFQGAPIRGAKWIERAYIDNKDSLLSSVERYANKG